MGLESLQVIITRPKHQAQALVDYVVSLKGKAILLPMMDIQPVAVDKAVVNTIQTSDLIVISSQNAVWFSPVFLMDILRTQTLPIITIGDSTTKALWEKEIAVSFTAPKGSQSETLLALEVLQSEAVFNKSIVLLAGMGGRDLIAQTLKARGARVTPIEVYKQVPIGYDCDLYFETWQQSDRQSCFIFTSANILHNFISQVSDKYLPWMLSQPIIVVSDRLVQYSKKYGFQHIFNAKGADLQSLASAMDSMKKVWFTGKRS